MRRKRLLCVCLVLALLLALPAHADEAPAPESTPPAQEETVLPETPEVPETSEDPQEDPAEEPAEELEEDPEEEPGEEPEGEPEADPEEKPAEDPEEAHEEAPEEEPAEKDKPAAISAEPVIRVEVPNMGRIVVNPYGLAVEVGGEISTEQIVSEPMPIISYSNVPIAVLASATGHTGPDSDAVFVSAPPPADAGSKELFVFAEFRNAYDEYGGAYWSGQYTGAYNQVPVATEKSAAREVLTLPAGDETPAYGAFKLFGSTSVPSSDVWQTQDTVQVTIAFTFLPMEPVVAAVPAETAEPIKDVEAAEAVEAVEPAETMEAIEPAESIEAEEPAEAIEPME